MKRALGHAVVVLALASAACGNAGTTRESPDASAGLTSSTPSGATLASADDRVTELRRAFALPPAAPVRFVDAGETISATIDGPAPTRPASLSFARKADGAHTLRDLVSGLAVSFRLEGATSVTAKRGDGVLVFPGALAGADVIVRPHAEGAEDYVAFDTKPTAERLAYRIDVGSIPGLRLVENTLEFVQEDGTPVIHVAPPSFVDATGARTAARLSVEGCNVDRDPSAPWGRPVTHPGADTCTVAVTWSASQYPILVDPAWATTGSMSLAKRNHAATVLNTGKILVTGGYNSPTYYANAELYNPAGTGTFAATGSMATVRRYHVSTLLASGKVLVAGGYDGTNALASAATYDPVTGVFTAAGNMGTGRRYHVATRLASGKVLVAGGYDGTNYLASAELYDPNTNAFTATGGMTSVRGYGHAVNLLASGKVLATGGGGSTTLATAELYDPTLGNWSGVASMSTVRYYHATTTLASGKVLVTGGLNAGAAYLASAEIFDPGNNQFTATGALGTARQAHDCVTLPSGKALCVCGASTGAAALNSTELFDPTANGNVGAFTNGGGLATARYYHTTSLLPSGKVVLTGGQNAAINLASAEMYGGINGDTCTVAEYCLSGFCSDGYCCATACNAGGCDRCDLPNKHGTCTIASAGDPGVNPVCAAPYACDGVSAVCPTTCTTDAACAANAYCASDGTCKLQKNAADACDLQVDCKQAGCRECGTGFCADKVCCDKACNGTCEACVGKLKQSGGGDGQCGPIKDGIDPKNECEPTSVVCGPDGFCNGTGACRLLTPAGISCSNDGKVCNGTGDCTLPPTPTCDGNHTTKAPDGGLTDCSPYTCDNDGTCRKQCTSIANCVAPNVCNASGQCVPPPPPVSEEGGCNASGAGSGSGAFAFLAMVVVGFGRRRRASGARR